MKNVCLQELHCKFDSLWCSERFVCFPAAAGRKAHAECSTWWDDKINLNLLPSRFQTQRVPWEAGHRHHGQLCEQKHDGRGQGGGDQWGGLHLQPEVLPGAEGGDRCVWACLLDRMLLLVTVSRCRCSCPCTVACRQVSFALSLWLASFLLHNGLWVQPQP